MVTMPDTPRMGLWVTESSPSVLQGLVVCWLMGGWRGPGRRESSQAPPAEAGVWGGVEANWPADPQDRFLCKVDPAPGLSPFCTIDTRRSC